MHDSTENKLTAPQQKLLVELIRNPDVKAASKAAGIGRTTAYRWLDQPFFAQELSRLRDNTMNEALSSVKSLTARAATELSQLLDTDNERLQRLVCKDILNYAIRIQGTEAIERRLILLEKKFDLQERRF